MNTAVDKSDFKCNNDNGVTVKMCIIKEVKS